MAGLSLAYYLDGSEKLRNKKILIVDKEQKNKNDRTWCFWERTENNPFEEIVYRKWQKLNFFGTDFTRQYELSNYFYKMIRGIDFYDFLHAKLHANSNIRFLYASVKHMEDQPAGATVTTSEGVFTGKYVFDSTFRPDFKHPGAHFLLQHFKGWVLTTPTPQFDPVCATLHDFRTDQHGDEARFFYLLPFSPTQALVEYTLFSPQLLPQEQYDAELRGYISEKLGLTAYTINEEEFGVIPMSDAPVSPQSGRHIMRIGTAGGYVRPSTGYTFARTQRYLQKIVRQLEESGQPVGHTAWFDKRFGLYDSIMLNVLTRKRYSGAAFFNGLYRNNPIERIFDFLDEQSHPLDELRLMATVPLWAFTKGAADVIFRHRLRFL